MRRICVYCGSKTGDHHSYVKAAAQLGECLARGRHGLVYGGGSVGLMGIIADAVLSARGEIIGVIPERLATNELLHSRVPDMRVVSNMHERKALMAELADGFIAMPGGFGTLEELFEVVTWAQLGFHQKRIGLLNVNGYFDSLIAFIDHSIAEGFVKRANRELFVVSDDPANILQRLEQHEMPTLRKW